MPEKKKPEMDEYFQSMMDQRLLKARTLTIFGEINQKVASNITEKLLIMANESDEKITIFINSQGGHVEAGDTIYDMIQFVEPRVRIIGTGWVASAGALIYAAPTKERRLCLPNTRFMLHQPSGGVMGPATDIDIEAREIIKIRKRLNEIFAKQTGQSLEKIEQETERNFWMTAEEAKKYGLVGKIIKSIKDLQ
ncbi:ATP-dependent Clp protease proteolytic subunit [candidate division KSB1 bacterium]|nr:ATP-dependent Clp protease proteolytic subunit [candidate division KSB1 bacterium]